MRLLMVRGPVLEDITLLSADQAFQLVSLLNAILLLRKEEEKEEKND